MADDLLPKDINTKVKEAARKCRDAGNGKFWQMLFYEWQCKYACN
jgi:hypothetical protein